MDTTSSIPFTEGTLIEWLLPALVSMHTGVLSALLATMVWTIRNSNKHVIAVEVFQWGDITRTILGSLTGFFLGLLLF